MWQCLIHGQQITLVWMTLKPSCNRVQRDGWCVASQRAASLLQIQRWDYVERRQDRMSLRPTTFKEEREWSTMHEWDQAPFSWIWSTHAGMAGTTDTRFKTGTRLMWNSQCSSSGRCTKSATALLQHSNNLFSQICTFAEVPTCLSVMGQLLHFL